MDLSKLHPISNSFQDLRLVSLSKLKLASEFSDRDHAGPFVVAQEGYDPKDANITFTEFLLNRSGAWLPTAWFFRLPTDQRRAEFCFARAAEVMQLLNTLPSKPVIIRPGERLAEEAPAENADEIQKALKESRQSA